jgi:arsenate reductase
MSGARNGGNDGKKAPRESRFIARPGQLAAPDAPAIDLILTVCDNAASEACPVWPGKPITAHWGIPDPAAVEGEGQREAFLTAYRRMSERIRELVALPTDRSDLGAIARRLRELGRLEGGTS